MKDSIPTPFELHVIAADIRQGRANPTDARRLIEMFCVCVDAELPFHRWLLLHLRDSFQCYLNDEKRSMGSAFGLKRRRGRPNVPEQRQLKFAVEVIRLRLTGMMHQEALEQVAERYGCAESVIGEAYSMQRLPAVAALRNERSNGFTDAEKATLHRILPKEAVSHTGKSNIKPV